MGYAALISEKKKERERKGELTYPILSIIFNANFFYIHKQILRQKNSHSMQYIKYNDGEINFAVC